MKTIAAFTMALVTLVLAAAADADAQDQRCQGNRLVWVRPGTPCVILPPFGYHYSEIIEPPHNGTAVLRADGSIYYSPKPGFTGGDSMRVRGSNGAACQLREVAGSTYFPPCYETRRLGFRVE
jgi:hypothetical protein